MSELQTFKNSAEWREKLRHFLLRENPTQSTLQPKEFHYSESNRYSFDISEDLKKLIEEKKQKQQLKHQSKMAESENKENEPHAIVEDTFLDGEKSMKHEISDESFEAMEKMCNKTASDPNSTLFKYLEEQKNHAPLRISPRGFKKSSTDTSRDQSVEMTQIEDIEAPSYIFNNETILQTSPVKMVGLLRPSTILECAETSDVSSSSSAQTSFKSIPNKYALSEASSSCYETASDTISFSKANNVALKTQDLLAEQIKAAPIKAEKLIDLTIQNEECEELEESVIDLLSDEETKDEQTTVNLIEFEKLNNSTEINMQDTTSLMKFEDVSISVANDEQIETSLIKFDDSINPKRAEKSESEHTRASEDAAGTGIEEQSLHFNDTLEEVEYIMQKGLEIMANAGLTPKKSSPKRTAIEEQSLYAGLTPKKSPPKLNNDSTKLASIPRQEDKTAMTTPSSKPCIDDRFVLNIKPIPKLDLFKKPLSATKSAIKSASRQKDKFAHVVSPIGTYIKQTPEAPFMSRTKTQNDVKNSSAFRELDFESRQYRPDFVDSVSKTNNTPISRSLPKKAYISSEYRQVVDQRTPVTIPGGKSIQKYLDSAVLPGVIKHEGKANFTSDLSATPTKSNEMEQMKSQIPKRTGSLKDLSVMAGDISVYSLQNSKKP